MTSNGYDIVRTVSFDKKDFVRSGRCSDIQTLAEMIRALHSYGEVTIMSASIRCVRSILEGGHH